jgi:hypothetical protein|tara:strand:- start:54 stop:398 length:345 start_codon:yes stop_codon:yes gene_type:complete
MAYVGTGAASAWVNFDGTGTPSIRDDHNCSSIGDVGTGLYLMNIFSGVLPDDDICVQITADNWEGTNADSYMVCSPRKDNIYSGGVRFQCVRLRFDQNPPQFQDPSNVMVSVHR